MRLVHLTASTFFGGPERQMLGLAQAMPGHVHTTFASFSEGGRCAAFLDKIQAHDFPTVPLTADFPHVFKAVRELSGLLHDTKCDTLICHGYKAHILGRMAARRAGIPAIAVSRGWTGETRKVKLYEWLDRRHLRFMDHVVCVSDGQAAKVRRWCGVRSSQLSVIRNSARLAAFETRDPAARSRLLGFLPADSGVSQVVLAAGRFSPEKGFGVLVEAAATICKENPSAGVVLFGEGVLRPELEAKVRELGIANRFVMPGFRTDLDSLIGAADIVVLPSFTEGLPNVALEASAAGVPVVATAVGGTPEAVIDSESGYLVPSGQPDKIAARVGELLRNPALCAQFGAAGKKRMQTTFTFDAQAAAYLDLLKKLKPQRRVVGSRTPPPTPSPEGRGGKIRLPLPS
ncbi:MAG: glycosyltransferase family 4 protein [Planctomycetes bacterium]|nr:glycosyltransferase family 4 protein [Planctomycetota bacterium]